MTDGGRLRELDNTGAGNKSEKVKAKDSTIQKFLCQGGINNDNGMEGSGCLEDWGM